MTTNKRGHGEGSFRERRKGFWEHRFTLPNGDRKSVYGTAKAECRQKRKEEEERFRLGLESLNKNQTVETYLKRWLSDTAQPRLRPRTFSSYESLIRIRVLPHIGRVKLTELSPQHLEALKMKLLDSNLSPRSVQYTHNVVHSALKQAFRWGLIASNPADKVSPPRPGRHEIRTLSEGQAKTLLLKQADLLTKALYTLAVTTGMRQGEQLGLLWADIDLGRATVAIRRTLQWQKGEGLVLGEVKTERSKRSVVLSPLAVDALRKWQIAQKERRLQAGPAWEERYPGLVFTDPTGKPLDGGRVTEQFKRALVEAELPMIRYHDLRHTAATLLLSEGIHPKVVQEMLGHATIAVTMDTYSHVTLTMQQEAAGVWARMLG